MFNVSLVELPHKADGDFSMYEPSEEAGDYPADSPIEWVISDACKILASSGRFRFVVAGFGDEAWPLDVAVDLMTFVEQLSGLIACLYRSTCEYLLVFYEQGVERSLIFTTTDNTVLISCSSWGEWQPDYPTESMERSYFIAILESFVVAFMRAVQSFGPQVYNSPLFMEWREDLLNSINASLSYWEAR